MFPSICIDCSVILILTVSDEVARVVGDASKEGGDLTEVVWCRCPYTAQRYHVFRTRTIQDVGRKLDLEPATHLTTVSLATGPPTNARFAMIHSYVIQMDKFTSHSQDNNDASFPPLFITFEMFLALTLS
ncbi:hypothetical protein PoB_002749500 [Plakobranchus ocellatus]|uniref:Uncharacterized protein n=1 Tax=Plakobranchus ocellatus TaxID=259542 RepID=A0AAV4A240_9GAST|nr:hypothetical protein PoB_002749500 [Plakobranchus ocellatus]